MQPQRPGISRLQHGCWNRELHYKLQSEFLNPPLSADQRETFDRLVASAETMDIHGHRIVLACGEIIDANEEISTLAHKLRDLFDPDALFVLVSTNEGVRLGRPFHYR